MQHRNDFTKQLSKTSIVGLLTICLAGAAMAQLQPVSTINGLAATADQPISQVFPNQLGVAPAAPSAAQVVPIGSTGIANGGLISQSKPTDGGPTMNPPVSNLTVFQGEQEFGDPETNWIPPDTNGAAGIGQFVEGVNSVINVYDTGTGILLATTPQRAFVGDPLGQSGFDPAVQYDAVQDRFIVTITQFETNAGTQFWSICASQSGDATGPWWIYRTNPRSLSFTEADDFVDYQHVGQTQDSIIVTANMFHRTGGFKYAFLEEWPKARVYNGRGLTFWYFNGLNGTLMPPNVRDENIYAWLIAASNTNGTDSLYRLTEGGIPPQLTLFFVNEGAWAPPSRARQPGTTATMDALDGRFQMASAQWRTTGFSGDTILIAAHAVGFPLNKLVKIDTATGAVTTSLFYVNGPSNDWNPSVDVDGSGNVYATWSTSFFDPTTGFPSMAFAKNPGTFEGTGVIVAFGTVAYTDGRWGDYSQVSQDPTNGSFWAVNEVSDIAGNIWDSYFANGI